MYNIPCSSGHPCLAKAFQHTDGCIKTLYTMDGNPCLLDFVLKQIRLTTYSIRTRRVYSSELIDVLHRYTPRMGLPTSMILPGLPVYFYLQAVIAS